MGRRASRFDRGAAPGIVHGARSDRASYHSLWSGPPGARGRSRGPEESPGRAHAAVPDARE